MNNYRGVEWWTRIPELTLIARNVHGITLRHIDGRIITLDNNGYISNMMRSDIYNDTKTHHNMDIYRGLVERMETTIEGIVPHNPHQPYNHTIPYGRTTYINSVTLDKRRFVMRRIQKDYTINPTSKM